MKILSPGKSLACPDNWVFVMPKNNISKSKFKIWSLATYFVYGLVVIFALLVISARFSFFGVRMLVVQSGSMAPTIGTGSLVINKSERTYQIDDIVTFKNREKLTETTTHRIVEIENQGNVELFTTQGDANNAPDSTKLTEDRILGRVVFAIPYFGYLVAFSRTTPGLIILIIIPATIIIYDEINKLKKYQSG